MKLNNKQSVERESKLIVADNPLSRASEEFRILRTNIQFASGSQNLSSITVTAPYEGIGTTTVAVNLAATFAQERKMVLLVDTNFRNPEIHKFLGVSNEIGLSDMLTNRQLNLVDIIGETQMSNLHFISSGKVPLNSAELLNSERMMKLIERMQNRYGLVIFDTPPLLSYTDAQIMAAKSSGTILVLPEDDLKDYELREATNQLNNVQANVLGTVINQIKND